MNPHPRRLGVRPRRRTTTLALLTLLALGTTPSLAQEPSPDGRFPDVVQYRVDGARTNVQPGAAPTQSPVLAWRAILPDAVAFPPLLIDGILLVGDASGGFHALDAAAGAERWSVTLAAPPIGAVGVGAMVIVVDGDGGLHGLEVATGTEAWTGGPLPDVRLAGVAVADGRVLIGTDDARIHAIDAATGADLDAWDAPGPVGSLTVVEDVAYLGTTDGWAGAVDLRTGDQPWPPVRLLSAPPGSIGVADGRMVIASRQPPGDAASELLAIDTTTGSVLWRFRAPSGRQVTPGGPHAGTVYVSTSSDGLYALDVATGDVRWHVADAPGAGSPPSIAGDLVVMHTDERTLEAYSTSDGSRAWQVATEGSETGSPIASGGLVFDGDGSGAVSAYGAADPSPSSTPGPGPSDPAVSPAAGSTAITRSVTWRENGIPGLDQPCQGDISPDGDLVIPNCLTDEILVIGPRGRVELRFGGTGTKEGQFRFLRDPSDPFSAIGGVTVAPDGTIYVADTMNKRVQRFAADGTFMSAFGSYGRGDGQFMEPFDLAAGPDGTIYVVDDVRDDIQRFSADGRHLQRIGSHGPGDGQLNFTGGIDVGPDGTLLNADWDNERVQAWTADGTFLWSLGSRGGALGEFRKPCDVAMAADGRILVTEGDGQRVQVFASDLTPLGEWRAPAAGEGFLCGIAVTPSGTVYVSAPFDDRVHVLELAPQD